MLASSLLVDCLGLAPFALVSIGTVEWVPLYLLRVNCP